MLIWYDPRPLRTVWVMTFDLLLNVQVFQWTTKEGWQHLKNPNGSLRTVAALKPKDWRFDSQCQNVKHRLEEALENRPEKESVVARMAQWGERLPWNRKVEGLILGGKF